MTQKRKHISKIEKVSKAFDEQKEFYKNLTTTKHKQDVILLTPFGKRRFGTWTAKQLCRKLS